MSSKHIKYFDFLRGIAILMVVGIHTVPKLSWDNPGDIYLIVIRQLLNCAVPIFIALSAFFISSKNFTTFEDNCSFWKRQISKVYLPCLVWSIPYLLLSVKDGNNFGVSVLNYIACGFSIYYFIAVIIQLYFLTPFLIKRNIILGGVVSFIMSVGSIGLYVYSNLQLPLILFAGPFVVWIMFYMQGILISRMSRNYSISLLLVLLILCIFVQVCESQFLYTINGRGLGIKPSAFLFSYIVIFILFSGKLQILYERKTGLIKQLIEYIGQISFGIYLIHMFLVLLVGKFLDIQSWILNWIIVLAFTIITIRVLKIILPTQFVRKYLGFL